MPLKINSAPSAYMLKAQPLIQEIFAQFGTVIENPEPRLTPSAKLPSLPQNAVQANQGSALKYENVSAMLDLYSSAPSGVKGKAVMNMFVCAPRKLAEDPEDESKEDSMGIFEVGILERHPFTTQTFIPVGLRSASGRKGAEKTRYLVIVAPSRAPSPEDKDLPVPQGALGHNLPGSGLPDLTKLQAFIATGDQAVTYGVGTWHAPMVVIGDAPVSFVVVQYANGVAIEDCQEVVWERDTKDGSIGVVVPQLERPGPNKLWSKL